MQTETFNMQERKEPEFIQFAVGEVVEGVLMSIDRIAVGKEKKVTPRFVVRDLDSGEMRCFLGTYDIATKLKPSDVGHVISVRFEGEDPSVRRGDNNLKRFKVLVSEKPYRAASGADKALAETVITDDDIPF